MCGLPYRGAHAQEGEEMKDLSKLTCRIYGYGIFEIFLAQALGPMNGGFGKVELFCPWMDSFCKPAPRWIGRNIPGVTRIWEFFDNKDKVDTWAFFDVGDADIQQDLRAQGRAIFGTGGRQKKDGSPGPAASEIEIDRMLFKKTLIKRGLAVPKWKNITGIDNLRILAEEKPGFWVKPHVGERGIFETFYVESYEQAAIIFDWIAHELGPMRNVTEFMTEASIPGVEPGSDYFLSHGIPFERGLYGWENKGDGYACKVMKLSDMPQAVRKINDTMSPTWKECDIDGAISTEIRVGKSRVPYFGDACQRMGNPPAACISEIYENFPEIVRGIAHGEAVEPEFRGAEKDEDGSDKPVYAAELTIEASGADEKPIPFEMGKDEWRNIKLRTACRIDGEYYNLPFKKNGSTVAKAVGIGNSVEEAESKALEAAEKFRCKGKFYNKAVFEELHEAINEGKKYGVAGL